MKKKIYKVKITLVGVQPPVWRRVLLESNMLLSDFHKVIQSSMGWSNSHLHQFISGQSIYVDMRQVIDMGDIDYKKVRICDLLKSPKNKIVYEYDFGDSWQHIILLEDILEIDKAVKYPICLKGKRNCPPDDCGGVWGYQDMLEVLKNPEHEEYEDFIEWIGDEFDPEKFDKDYINTKLQSKNYGVYSW